MAVGENYIVDFSQAIAILRRQLASDDLPTIDIDQVKWRVLEMFEHVTPEVHLERIISDMLAHDYLYTEVEVFAPTAEQARREKIMMDGRLRDYFRGFGFRLHSKLKELGMLPTGEERYKVVMQPMDYETYILQRIR